MKEPIPKILKELESLDERFSKHRDETRQILTLLYANRPNVPLDQSFLSALREKVLKIAITKSQNSSTVRFLSIYAPVFASIMLLLCIPVFVGWERPLASDRVTMSPTYISLKTPHVALEPVNAKQSTPLEKKQGQNLVDGALTLTPQLPGNLVQIAFLALPYPGFIAIYSLKTGDIFEEIGRSRLLPKGTSEHFSIELREPLTLYGEFYAVLYTDNGDYRPDVHEDTPLHGMTDFPISVVSILNR